MRFLPLAITLLGVVLGAAAQSVPTADSVASRPPAVPPPPGLKAAKPTKRLKIVPIPAVFYEQETGIALGGGGLLSGRLGKDSTTRVSTMRTLAWWTQKSQSLVQLTHTIFTPGEKFFLGGEVSRYSILLNYYGVGNDTQEHSESNLEYKLLVINQRVLKKWANNLFAGVQYRFVNVTDIAALGHAHDGNANTFLTDSRVSPRDRQDHHTSLIGPVLTYDSRDNVLATFTGNYLDLSAMLGTNTLGSDYRFTRYQLDARHFQPVFGSTNTILVLQALGQFHNGDVPFNELAGLGANWGQTLYNGASLMRGVYEQRYRDRQMAVVQAEIRRKLFWRVGAALFGSAGQTGYQLNDFTGRGMKYAGGGGLRFNLIPRDRVNIRLDCATGTGGFLGLYFTIREAF